ncbi:MAG: phosphomannomutase [Bdellovibrionales bacterium RBG_16_40_8]|nr:MAG: phosphomannomutase [Bdellovibrionales bacterium RBG_16_40_8]
MAFKSAIFREYDIRGIYEQQFDLDFATQLGRAIVTFFAKHSGNKTPTISLGHDARLSSPAITNALANGILSCGANVTRLGLVTTPISYFSTFAINGIDGAVMITGSHNPPEYNGFKISVGKSTIFGSDIKTLEKIINDKDFLTGSGKENSLDIFPTYLARYEKEFGQLKSIPLVLDCANGAAGCIARKLYEVVGLKPTILFEEPDGTFPNHHPDPTVEENLTDLIKKVQETKSRIGIGFDGDADRIGIVDEEGKMIYGDELIALCARFILADNPGQKIIGDVKCSDRLYDYISKYGGIPIMWKTGHSLIKEKIKVEKSPFGGELSGHIFFADRNYGYDDSLYAGLRVVEILSKTGKSVRELLKDLPPAYNTPEIRINTTEEKKIKIVEALRAHFSKDSDQYKVNLIDGIRISFKNGWALARASNTQPVLVLRFESSTQSGLEEIQNKIESIVNPLL